MVTRKKGFGPKFGETVYMSEVNGARKITSDAHEQKARPRADIFP